MKQLFILAAVTAIAVAKPELYKEKEDFQFSRSSTDEGSKSGFYGAQRGNMGGNYERAHNMDSLAQNQMSGLVRQVEGELGDGAKQKSGSVYSAANSRGTYGSRHFDLSNLAGRNFQEGIYHDSSNAQSSQSGSAYNSASYTNSRSHNSGSRYGGYQRAASDAQTQTEDLQSLDNLQTNNQYDYGRSSGHSSGYQAQSGFQEHSEYDRNNANSHSGYGSNVRTRLVSATPVRIILTPGGRVAIPVAAQTYDASQGSSLIDQNTLNSEADILSQNNKGSSYIPTNSKRYESSYSYRKNWEKHDTIPTAEVIVTRTEGPIPKHSELYEDSDASRISSQHNTGVDSQSDHSSSASNRYNTVKSSQSRHQSNYNTQQIGDSDVNAYTQTGYNAGSNRGAASSDSLNGYQNQYGAGSRYHAGTSASNLNTYRQTAHNAGSHSDLSTGTSASNLNTYRQTAHNAGSHSDLSSQVEDLSGKPKSYQSSYSYHKSWERQGDPYTIIPTSNGYTNGQASQRLSSSIKDGMAYHSGSHYGHDQADYDENGHIRVARDIEQQDQDEFKELTQQSNINYEQQNLGQESQNRWENLEDLNQQVQKSWGQQNEGQKSQAQWDSVQDVSQQVHKNWEQDNLEQNSWDKLEDLEQRSQTQQYHNVGVYSQAFLKEVGFGNANHQTQDSRDIDINKSEREQDFVEDPPKPGPWDSIDYINLNISDTQEFDPTNEFKDRNQFHWLQNFGGAVQKNPDRITDVISEQEKVLTRSSDRQWAQLDNIDQQYEYLGIDNSPSMIYGYSNGFTNPSLHDTQLSDDTYRVNRDYNESDVWQSNLNNYADVANAESNSQVHTFQSAPASTLLNFWDKFDNIEKASGLSAHVHIPRENQTFVPRNNLTTISSNQFQPASGNNFSQSLFDKLLNYNKTLNASEGYEKSQTTLISHENKLTSQHEQHSKPFQQHSSSNDQPESSQDIGRGDIGPGIYNIDRAYEIPSQSYITSEKLRPAGFAPNLSLQINQTDTEKNIDEKISLQNDNGKGQNPEFSQNIMNTNVHKEDQSYFHAGRNPVQIHEKPDESLAQQIVKSLNKENGRNYMIELSRDINEQENSQKFGHNCTWPKLCSFGQENIQGLAQQNEKIGQQNLNVFREENIHDFGQYHDKNFGQESIQNYGQLNENMKQQTLHNIGQQNLQEQNENLKHQNSPTIGQQNLQHFGQPNENLEQQSFGQAYLPDFDQQANFEQQDLHNFDQNKYFEQQFENTDTIGQQNLQVFGQPEENIEQKKSQKFSQQNLHNFGQEKFEDRTLVQQHSRKDDSKDKTDVVNTDNLKQQNELLEPQFENDYVKYINQEGEHLEATNINIDQEQDQIYGQQFLPQQGSASTQKVNEDIEKPVPKKDVDNVKTPIQSTTESPGLWNTLGNKFSNAKSKMLSWFKS